MSTVHYNAARLETEARDPIEDATYHVLPPIIRSLGACLCTGCGGFWYGGDPEVHGRACPSYKEPQ